VLLLLSVDVSRLTYVGGRHGDWPSWGFVAVFPRVSGIKVFLNPGSEVSW
jgi:hypothetical protein